MDIAGLVALGIGVVEKAIAIGLEQAALAKAEAEKLAVALEEAAERLLTHAQAMRARAAERDAAKDGELAAKFPQAAP